MNYFKIILFCAQDEGSAFSNGIKKWGYKNTKSDISLSEIILIRGMRYQTKNIPNILLENIMTILNLILAYDLFTTQRRCVL